MSAEQVAVIWEREAMTRVAFPSCSVVGCENPASANLAQSLGLCGHQLCKIHENGACKACVESARIVTCIGCGGEFDVKKWTEHQCKLARWETWQHPDGPPTYRLREGREYA